MPIMSDQLPRREPTPVRRFLVLLVDAVCRCPRFVLALSLGLCLLSAYAAATRLQYHTSRSDLLSPRKDYQQRWKKYLAEFGDDDDVVAVVKGRDRTRMRQALELLADRVRDRPDLFDRLFYKVDLRGLRDRALLFLTPREIREIAANLQ